MFDAAATGSPPRAAATCSPSASRRCWPRSSTTPTACASSTPGSASGRLRAEGLRRRREPHLRGRGRRESAAATARAGRLRGPLAAGGRRRCCARWPTPASIELLGGPATHPFPPLLDERVAPVALRVGLDDAALRLGRRPAGHLGARVRVPRPGWRRCTRRPACERFLVDGPPLLQRATTAAGAWTGRRQRRRRASAATSRSPTGSGRRGAGYPGGRWYRDFHTFDHASGLQPGPGHRPARRRRSARRRTTPDRAAAAVARDARDFVDVVRRRLRELRRRATGGRGLVVAAYDTELFGHWWHEGPAWLERVLRRCPRPGCGVTTLRGAVAAGRGRRPVDLPAGVVGLGQGLAGLGRRGRSPTSRRQRPGVQTRLLQHGGRGTAATGAATPVLDQLAREALLALASDWAFMVSKDTAAGYARDRAAAHAGAVPRARRAGSTPADRAGAAALADRWRGSTARSATSTPACSRTSRARRRLSWPWVRWLYSVCAARPASRARPAGPRRGRPPGPPGLQVDPGRRGEQHDHTAIPIQRNTMSHLRAHPVAPERTPPAVPPRSSGRSP